ncbi:MAG TPA: diiron oxygenase [Pseudonocardia sp.]|jgi:hypothetical protein|nr:diiron oxygenase [Pseudonocardia sp.]
MTSVGDREKTAARLLRSSVARNYDPDVDLDWAAPLPPDKYFHPPEGISLYGTAAWERLSPEQRRELGRHEIACVASLGILSELGLMHMLLRVAAEQDPRSNHMRYALTEVADECRHSTMFGRAIGLGGTGAYQIPRWMRALTPLVALFPIGPLTWAATLLVEDLTDKQQRETMADERIQPAIRMVNRIHVVEEARHMTFAREELMRSVASAGRLEMAFSRVALALLAYGATRVRILPRVYRSVGIKPLSGWRAALRNPNYHRTLSRYAERMVATYREAGLLEGSLSSFLWRRSHLLGTTP